jgi:hypothetical protein
VAYIHAWSGDFQYDDFSGILENPHLDQWQTYVSHLDHMVRPVLHATFLVDRSLYGEHPACYHLLNVLLHLGSGILIYRILTRAATEETSSVPLWTALLFLIHPITTETVTYISGRASGLMTFFYLLALFLYLKASEQRERRTDRRLFLSGAVASYLLSLGAKETAVTFPLILLLWDVVIRRLRGSSLRAAIGSSHLPFWVILLIAAGWAWTHPRYRELAQFSFTIRPYWDHLLSQIHAIAYAMLLFFRPWAQNFDHHLPEIRSLFQWPVPLDLLLLIGAAAAALIARQRVPLITFGLSWFFAQLLPTSLIPRNDLLSERNLYLAALGLLLTVVVLCSRLWQWLKTALPQSGASRFSASGVAVIAVITLFLFTLQRNALYRDQASLWADTVLKSPNKARPHNNLGHAYALQGDWDRAIDEFRIAAKLDPDYALAHQNLRDAYLHRVGRY